MLSDLVHYALSWHSVRRLYFGEDLDSVRDKVQAAVRNGIEPIACVGETKNEHDAGETKQVLHDQIVTALMNLTSRDIEHIVIAYEPIWAISTFDGMIAKPQEAEEAIKFIRLQVRELYGEKAASEMRVLYGGSVNEHDVRRVLSFLTSMEYSSVQQLELHTILVYRCDCAAGANSQDCRKRSCPLKHQNRQKSWM